MIVTVTVCDGHHPPRNVDYSTINHGERREDDRPLSFLSRIILPLNLSAETAHYYVSTMFLRFWQCWVGGWCFGNFMGTTLAQSKNEENHPASGPETTIIFDTTIFEPTSRTDHISYRQTLQPPTSYSLTSSANRISNESALCTIIE